MLSIFDRYFLKEIIQKFLFIFFNCIFVLLLIAFFDGLQKASGMHVSLTTIFLLGLSSLHVMAFDSLPIIAMFAGVSAIREFHARNEMQIYRVSVANTSKLLFIVLLAYLLISLILLPFFVFNSNFGSRLALYALQSMSVQSFVQGMPEKDLVQSYSDDLFAAFTQAKKDNSKTGQFLEYKALSKNMSLTHLEELQLIEENDQESFQLGIKNLQLIHTDIDNLQIEDIRLENIRIRDPQFNFANQGYKLSDKHYTPLEGIKMPHNKHVYTQAWMALLMPLMLLSFAPWVLFFGYMPPRKKAWGRIGLLVAFLLLISIALNIVKKGVTSPYFVFPSIYSATFLLGYVLFRRYYK